MVTWGDLEQIIDASDLTRRNRTVLKAFSIHVNRPTPRRPYPENCKVWPSMETLMDATRYSLDTIQRAKRELLKNGILELVTPACRGPGGNGRTPRYYIHSQKIPPDDAVLQRQTARRERCRHARQSTPTDSEKGRQNPDHCGEKSAQNTDPFPGKGYAKCPPEVASSSKAPEPFNYPGGSDGAQKKCAIVPRTNGETV